MALAAVISAAVFVLNDGDSGERTATVVFITDENTTHTFFCEVADDHDERVEGLSGREALAEDSGMLFVFDSNGSAYFWMKDMQFPIDIIFIDENMTVINVVEAPVSQPDAELEKYSSDRPYRWVVEINYGLSQQLGIVPGTQVGIEMGL